MILLPLWLPWQQMSIPIWLLEIMLRAEAVVPPTTLLFELGPPPIPIPVLLAKETFPTCLALPVTSMPMKLPAAILLADASRMPAYEKRLMTNPLTVLEPLLIVRPLTKFCPALAPLNSMMGVPAKPGSVVASMITESVTSGSAESGAMVWTPAG